MKKGIITEAEYLEELGGLYDKVRREMPDASDRDIYIIYQEREFDLLIDFRMGDEFPDERRNALKKLHQQDVYRMEEFKSKLLSGDMSADVYAEAIQELAKHKMADLKALLDSNELKSLCGEGFQGIPLDINLIGNS